MFGTPKLETALTENFRMQVICSQPVTSVDERRNAPQHLAPK
jgi:hypothetical protein